MDQANGHGEKRSRKQDRIIAALLSYPTVEAAAKAVGIGDVTAWKWGKDPAFAERYRQATREVMCHTSARLQEATRLAVDCLREITLRTRRSQRARASRRRTRFWRWQLRRPTRRTYKAALTPWSRPSRKGKPNESHTKETSGYRVLTCSEQGTDGKARILRPFTGRRGNPYIQVGHEETSVKQFNPYEFYNLATMIHPLTDLPEGKPNDLFFPIWNAKDFVHADGRNVTLTSLKDDRVQCCWPGDSVSEYTDNLITASTWAHVPTDRESIRRELMAGGIEHQRKRESTEKRRRALPPGIRTVLAGYQDKLSPLEIRRPQSSVRASPKLLTGITLMVSGLHSTTS